MDKNIPPKFYGLDHLRALAISLVFFFHYYILSGGKPEWLPSVANFGWTGVDLFFVLSGFLISSKLFNQIISSETISIKNFFLNRFFRIIPAYLFTVGLYFLIPFFREKESLPPLWKFLTFTQNLGLNLKDYGTFSHAWSLCVEEHFYILLPLLLTLLQYTKSINKSYWLLIALFFLGFAFRIFSYDQLYFSKIEDDNGYMYWYKYLYYPTYNRLDGILVGVFIAGVYQFLPALWGKISKYGNLLVLIGLIVLTGAYLLCVDPMSYTASIFGFPIIAIGYGLMVAGAISPTCFLYKWKSKLTSFVATIAYATYLTHKGVIHMTHEILSNMKIHDNLILLISILLCICFAFLLHWAIELPFMKIKNRITGSK